MCGKPRLLLLIDIPYSNLWIVLVVQQTEHINPHIDYLDEPDLMNRVGEKCSIGISVDPLKIRSVIARPVAGLRTTPRRPWPVAKYIPLLYGEAPIIGRLSGVTGRNPALA